MAIKDQEKRGIIEKVHDDSPDKVFYMPHILVIKQSAESTKFRVVYEASAIAKGDRFSLNDCLEKGPQIQEVI